MKYSAFERLVLVVGAGTVLILIASALFQAQPDTKEIVAQLLIIPILVCTLHYGRWGGIVSSSAAFLVYIAMYLPTSLAIGYSSILPLLTVRALTYGIIGIGGGEIAQRIKYLFTRLEHPQYADELTGLYAKGRFAEIVDSSIEQFNRYQVTFSIITAEIDPKILPSLKNKNQQIKELGGTIRGNVRAIDEVARIRTATFGLLLPHTSVSVASKVNQRLEKIAVSRLAKTAPAQGVDTLVRFKAIEYPEDKEKIEKLAEELKLHQ